MILQTLCSLFEKDQIVFYSHVNGQALTLQNEDHTEYVFYNSITPTLCCCNEDAEGMTFQWHVNLEFQLLLVAQPTTFSLHLLE